MKSADAREGVGGVGAVYRPGVPLLGAQALVQKTQLVELL